MEPQPSLWRWGLRNRSTRLDLGGSSGRSCMCVTDLPLNNRNPSHAYGLGFRVCRVPNRRKSRGFLDVG